MKLRPCLTSAALVAISATASALSSPSLARADDAPSSLTADYSEYELVAIREAERALGAVIDATPEGKTIESIETVRLDPIEQRDPVPTALNVVHTTTKHEVITHEVLLRVGERYRKVIADESARNIRSFAKVSIVVVAPLKGKAKDSVRLVVITKDTWSLIADVDFHFTRGGAEYLMFELERQTSPAHSRSSRRARSSSPRASRWGARTSRPDSRDGSCGSTPRATSSSTGEAEALREASAT